MSITLRFACGHVVELDDTVTGEPSCALCGNSHVARVSTSRPPRFKGCRGPYADGEALPGTAVSEAAPKGPLLKEDDHG